MIFQKTSRSFHADGHYLIKRCTLLVELNLHNPISMTLQIILFFRL